MEIYKFEKQRYMQKNYRNSNFPRFDVCYIYNDSHTSGVIS